MQPQGLECPDVSRWWDFMWSMNIYSRECLSPAAEKTHTVSMCVHTVTSERHLVLPERKKDEAIGRVSVLAADVCVSDLCACLCIYGYTRCMCVLGVCTCWEHICSLTAGQTWGYWSTSASPLFSCWRYFPLAETNYAEKSEKNSRSEEKASGTRAFDALSLNPDSYVLVFYQGFYSCIYICQKWQMTVCQVSIIPFFVVALVAYTKLLCREMLGQNTPHASVKRRPNST